MAEKNSNFRATIFLEEHFSFLQDNNETTGDYVTDKNKYNGCNQMGGPLSVKDNFAESISSKCDNSVDHSRTSVSSVDSSRQSDISPAMSLRTSSASMSSRESEVSRTSDNILEGLKPEETTTSGGEKKEPAVQGNKDTHRGVRKTLSVDESPDSEKDMLEKENTCAAEPTVSEQASSSNTKDKGDTAAAASVLKEDDKKEESEETENCQSEAIANGGILFKKTPKEEAGATEDGVELQSCAINQVTGCVPSSDRQTDRVVDTTPHDLSMDQLKDRKSGIIDKSILRRSAAVENDRVTSRQSVMADGMRVSAFVNGSFKFLDDAILDGDNDDASKCESLSSGVNQEVKTEESDKHHDLKQLTSQTTDNTNSIGSIVGDDFTEEKEVIPGIELTTAEMDVSKPPKTEKELIPNKSISVPMRDSKSDASRKGTISEFIEGEFNFLTGIQEDTHDSSDDSSSTIETTDEHVVGDCAKTTKSFIHHHHSRNLSADLKIHEKPRSPVIDRVRQSDVSHGSQSSTRSGSTSPGPESSRSSSWGSDTESGDNSTDNEVFSSPNKDRGSLQRAKTLTDQTPPSPISPVTKTLLRSVSVSTTVSEKEFRTHFRQKDIERPMKQKESKSKSISSSKFVRETKYIPEVTVVLEKTDPLQTYGFHFIKEEENKYISPWLISTVESGGIAEAKAIEVGSRLLTVNGEDIVEMPLLAVVELIKTDPCKVELTLWSAADLVPQKSGYLWKQSSGIIKAFKKRWFILKQDNCLYYYKTKEDIEPLGAICLSNYSVSKAVDIDPAAFKLLKFDQKSFVLKAESPEDMMEWGGVIEQAANAKNKSYPETTAHCVNLPAIQIKDPDFYGYLHKRGDTRKVWRKRYCVLKDGSLYYYKDPHASQARGVAHLHGYLLTSEFSYRRKHGFVLSPPDLKMRTYYFGTDTESERKKWEEAMHLSISRWKQQDGGEDAT